MQIFVIGMHRSGTSMVCRLINLMGAYFGPEGCQWEPNEENPGGFWERKDFRQLNDEILEASNCTWDQVSNWSLDGLGTRKQTDFSRRAKRLLFRLESFRPWVTKEPRFCLTFPLFHAHCGAPVIVNVARRPEEVALSLCTRNDIPTEQGLELWQHYVRSQLEVTSDCPRLLVRHDQLINDPVKVVHTLHADLLRHEVSGLRLPSAREINGFVTPSLYRSRVEESPGNSDAQSLYESLVGSA